MDIRTIGLMGPVETAAFRDILPSPGNRPYPKGLGGSPVNLLALELHRRGYSVVLFSLDPCVETEMSVHGDSFAIHFGPFRPKRARDFFAAEIKWLSQAVAKHPTDILHAHWTYEYALAAQATGLPYLVTAHDAPFNVLRHNFIPYRIARTLMACKAVRQTRHLSAVAPYVANHLKRCLFYRRPIRIIPNGMPDAIFNRVKTEKPPDTPTTFATVLVGWSGYKNSEAAVLAFASLRKTCPDCRLIMFGAGHGSGEPAEQWAWTRGLEDGIEFAGQLPYEQLIRRLRDEVDILVHPALEEAQPMALIEPMAMGIPVIAGQNSGGVPWTLDHGKAGILVDVTRPERIAEAMLRLARNKEERQQTGQAGLSEAKRRFHIRVVGDAYLQAYQDILAERWS
jgi:glycosyltransferase involved in cell wall biosynthesis